MSLTIRMFGGQPVGADIRPAADRRTGWWSGLGAGSCINMLNGILGRWGTREGRLQIESGSCGCTPALFLPTGGQRSPESAGPRLLEVFLRAQVEDGSGAATRFPPHPFCFSLPPSHYAPSPGGL